MPVTSLYMRDEDSRERVNGYAAELGYTTSRGPGGIRGDLGAMLGDILEGELVVVGREEAMSRDLVRALIRIGDGDLAMGIDRVTGF